MKNIIIVIALCTLSLIALAMPTGLKHHKRVTFVATIHPIAAIVEELAEGRADVVTLLPPSASPHTYEYTPLDVAKVNDAMALIYVGENLDQFWAEKLCATRKDKLVKLLDFVPNDYRLPNTDIDEGEPVTVAEGGLLPNEATDAHFWTDPVVVKAMVPGLVNKLCELDRGGEEIYRANGKKFMAELDALNTQIAGILAPIKGSAVFLLHPSFQYLCHQYGLKMEQTVEPSPGKNPSGNDIKRIIDQIRQTGAKAIFSEPQLSRLYAQSIARDAGIAVHQLDPEGTGESGMSYADFMLYNANVLRKALE